MYIVLSDTIFSGSLLDELITCQLAILLLAEKEMEYFPLAYVKSSSSESRTH